MADKKKDVRLQVFLTDSMDDKLGELSELMGMRKNEVVRVAIASYIASWNQCVGKLK